MTASNQGASPTFRAVFQDGTETRMTTWHASGHKSFDLERGIALSKAAYQSRMRTDVIPPLVEGRFERNGEVLKSYTPDELNRGAS